MNLRSLSIRLAGSALLAATLALAACNANVRRGGTTTVVAPASYDMTISAYKDNQFVLDGAVLTSTDLEAHFRYLKDVKQLPKSVLLQDGEKTKVNNAALQEFASLQLTFGFSGYVLHKGKVTVVNAVEAKKKGE